MLTNDIKAFVEANTPGRIVSIDETRKSKHLKGSLARSS